MITRAKAREIVKAKSAKPVQDNKQHAKKCVRPDRKSPSKNKRAKISNHHSQYSTTAIYSTLTAQIVPKKEPENAPKQPPYKRFLQLLNPASTLQSEQENNELKQILTACKQFKSNTQNHLFHDFIYTLTTLLSKQIKHGDGYTSQTENGHTCLHDIITCLKNVWRFNHIHKGCELVELSVSFALRHKSDPNATNRYMQKPADLALEYYDQYNCCVENASIIKIIAILLTNKSMSTQELMHELFELKTSYAIKKSAYAHIIALLNPDDKHLLELENAFNNESVQLDNSKINISKQKLGAGSYGQVFKGSNEQGKVFAIKLYHYFDFAEYVGEFVHSKMHHPNIINYVSQIRRGNKTGFIMEYAGSGTLDKYIYGVNYKFSTTLLYKIATELNSGLQYLHDCHYIHSDLKPDNILLNNAEVKLADFGCVEKIGDKIIDTHTYFPYRPPESFKLEGEWRAEYDTFSYCLIIAEFSSREEPWESEGWSDNEYVIEHNITNSHQPGFGSKLPPKVAKLVKWGLHSDPSQRPKHEEVTDYLDTYFKPHAK